MRSISLISILLAGLLLSGPVASTAEVTKTAIKLVALFDGKAMFSVNGNKPKIITAGKSYAGVKLVQASTDEVVVEVNGQRQILTLDGGTVLSQSLGSEPAFGEGNETQVFADGSGSFTAGGTINGQAVTFMVDTGANLVVLSGEVADRIGLDYQSGQRSVAATAQGTTVIYRVNLDRVNFNGIQLYNIEAGVIPGGFPVIPLLGMSYLNSLDMSRQGNRLILRKRL